MKSKKTEVIKMVLEKRNTCIMHQNYDIFFLVTSKQQKINQATKKSAKYSK